MNSLSIMVASQPPETSLLSAPTTAIEDAPTQIIPPGAPTVRGLLSGMSTTSMISENSGPSSSSNPSKNNFKKSNRKRKTKRLSNESPNGRSHSTEPMDWFQCVHKGIHSGRWDSCREMLNLRLEEQSNRNSGNGSNNSSTPTTPESPRKKFGFWRRITGVTGNISSGDDRGILDNKKKPTFLQQDKDGRTILHAALTHSSTPSDILLLLIQVERQAAAVPNAKGRFPLHTAVWYGHDMEVIAELVEAYPAAIGATDGRGQTPLAYAMATAIQKTNIEEAPSSFWMPYTSSEEDDEDEEAQARTSAQKHWQEAAVERWAVVHWLLLASATYPQTSLTVGGQKPMLVEALVFAAPPAVVSLLIGASVVLLSYEKRASAFAGTTLYTCIARQYPSSILMSLALQCPADVCGVADETGMGLIAAQFVVGCFQRRNDATEEWALVEDIWMAIQETIMEGQLPDRVIDPALCDWWAKIEFLILFCAGNPQRAQAMSSSSKSKLRNYLLHQAAINSDVPPTVLRLLLALYPQSAALPAPTDMGLNLKDALPLHLVAQTPEYLPRNYELPIMTSENALDIVLQANLQAVWEPHRGRLPLHWAISRGKSYPSIKALVEVDPDRMLRILDPETQLYPFLLAAYVYGVDGLGQLPKEYKRHQEQRFVAAQGDVLAATDDYDAYGKAYVRWTRMARNQYTHYVWKGLSERQKAAAVYRVIQGKSVSGLSTIWELLLHTPDLVPQSPFKRVPTNSARDDRGVGTVANHFLSFCYSTAPIGRNTIQGDPVGFHEEHWSTLREAIRTAPSGGLANIPTDFEKWFHKMRFWIRYCCPANPSVRRGNAKSLRVDPRWDCPGNDDDFLLHMAVMNPDTPPVIINLLLGAAPISATMPIPNTRFLPLHIACRTPAYVPRIFEAPYDSCIRILSRVYPEATREVDDDNKLPLHRAIESRKSWSDLEVLVKAYPQSLVVRTPDSRLFPFQQMALPKPITRIQRLNSLYKARNSVETELWESYTPLEKVQVVRQQRKQDDLGVLTCIFELFRRNVYMVEPSSVDVSDQSSHSRTHPEYFQDDYSLDSSESTLNVPGLSTTNHTGFEFEEEEDMTENDTIYTEIGHTTHTSGEHTFAGREYTDDRKASGSTGPTDEGESESSDSAGGYLPTSAEPSALLSFLSDHEHTQSKKGETSVFDCDTSVLSNVDVLSTLSSTLHSTLHSTRHQTRKEVGRRYSTGGKAFESEHGRVSEAGEESSAHEDPDAAKSDSDSSSSGSGDEFGGDSSAYLSFAISGNSGHMSWDEDESGDDSPEMNADAESFASAAQSVSENSDSSSSSIVHFQMRRKQRVEYWEDRETMDPVRVTKQNLQLRTDDISSVYSANSSAKQSSAQQSFINQNSDSMSSTQQSCNNQNSISSVSVTNVEQSPMTKSVSLRSMKSTGMDSYASLNSKDLMQSSVTDMVWMPEELVQGKLLGGQNSSAEFDESMLVELSSKAFKESMKALSNSAQSPPKSVNSDSYESSTETDNHETFYEEDDGVLHLQSLIQLQEGDSQTTEEEDCLLGTSESTESDNRSEKSETTAADVDNSDKDKSENSDSNGGSEDSPESMEGDVDESAQGSDKSERKREAKELERIDAKFDVGVANYTGEESEIGSVGEFCGSAQKTSRVEAEEDTNAEVRNGAVNARSALHRVKNSSGNPESIGTDAGKSDPSDIPGTSIESVRETEGDGASPMKSTDTLRRFLLTSSLGESESEFGPKQDFDNSNHSDGSMGIDDVFSSNASHMSSASTKSSLSRSSKCSKQTKLPSSEGTKRAEGGDTVTNIASDGIREADVAQLEMPNNTNCLHTRSPEKPIMNQDKLNNSNSSHDDDSDATALGFPTPIKKIKNTEIVYFDRKAMRWIKKEAEASKPLTELVSTSKLTGGGTREDAQPQKKEMYFDRKSMRWKVRQATGENSARNLKTNLSSIDEKREASQYGMLTTKGDSQYGSSSVGLTSMSKMATDIPAKPEKRITVKINLGSIPEQKTGSTSFLLSSKNMTCLLCNTNPREVLLKPCQHLAICRVCSREYKEIAMCPLCEGVVTDRMLIF